MRSAEVMSIAESMRVASDDAETIGRAIKISIGSQDNNWDVLQEYDTRYLALNGRSCAFNVKTHILPVKGVSQGHNSFTVLTRKLTISFAVQLTLSRCINELCGPRHIFLSLVSNYTQLRLVLYRRTRTASFT